MDPNWESRIQAIRQSINQARDHSWDIIYTRLQRGTNILLSDNVTSCDKIEEFTTCVNDLMSLYNKYDPTENNQRLYQIILILNTFAYKIRDIHPIGFDMYVLSISESLLDTLDVLKLALLEDNLFAMPERYTQ